VGTKAEPNVASTLSRFRRWAKRLLGPQAEHKKTEITIETDRILIIRRRRSTRAWCPECGGEVDMVGLAEAEAITGTMQPMLQDSAESREWHLAKGQGGTPLICLESLRKSQANDGIVRRKISGGGTL
jgi:hypothetical protein